MKTIDNIAELRADVQIWKRHGFKIGFVPTMGNLHKGHIALVEEAKKHCDITIASIFVNPLQFGENEDLDAYPRTLDDDIDRLREVDCGALFTPFVDEFYPHGQANETTVSVPSITAGHCGDSRPTHFNGVTTVVNKLFNLVQPDIAVFGKKDYQQLQVIKKMVADTCMPVEVVGLDTVREADGLAMSSRNQYLSAEQRSVAPELRRALLWAAEQSQQGEAPQTIAQQATQRLQRAGFRPDYFNIVRQADLKPVADGDKEWVILAAAQLGNARLIDNIEIFIK